jgi:LasA protease
VRAGAVVAVLIATLLGGLPSGASAGTLADPELPPFPTMTLPFAAGQQVWSQGIHSDNGSTGVMNAIDLSPVDKTVRAPLAGIVHLQHCAGGDWVTIDHDGGWRTGYYHMEGIVVTDGEQVTAGTKLGSTGNALPCGGSSTGGHVHFTLWTLPPAAAGAARKTVAAGDWSGISYDRLSTTVAAAVGQPIDGKTIGGYLFKAGATEYSGTATYGLTKQVISFPGEFRYAS